MKKIISVIISVLIIILSFTISCYANDSVTLSLQNETVYAGDEFTVNLFISDNSKISGAVIDINYDKSKLEFVSAKEGAILDAKANISIRNINKDNSYVRFAYMSNGSSVTSEGILFSVTFKVVEVPAGKIDPGEDPIVTAVRELKEETGYTAGNVFYQAGIDNVPGFADCYNTIENNVKSSLKIPSFTSRNQIDAPTIMLEGEVTTITDTNGVLPHFTFTDGNGASFRKNGNALSITRTNPVSESDVFSAVRNIPSADNSTFSVFYGATSTYQTCINLYSPKHSDLNAYFRIQDISAALEIQKTTEDGTNLEGWQFSIFSDSGCSNLISGPHTTDAKGKISVADLTAGTVYVKELGHTDSAINALYSCDCQNPQTVVLTAGETAKVSFLNKLNVAPSWSSKPTLATT